MKAYLARLFVMLLFLFFTYEPTAWPANEQPKSPAQKRNTLSSSKSKKKPKEPAKHKKKEVRRSKKGDTVPMPPLMEAPFQADVALLPVLREAKKRLSKEKVSYFSGPGGTPQRRELKLALADFGTGRIKIISGHEEKQGLYLNDSSVRYSVNWWNGFNSSIDVLEPPKTAVVGLLYALDPKRRSALRREAVIYTPYSRALLQHELVEAGRVYLSERISHARRELRHVRSRARSRTPLEDGPVFTEGDYFNLILAEHMDPESFRAITGQDTALDSTREQRLLRLVNRILVIIGSNQEDAYKFTGNYASARGLTQFTPIGMRVVWNKYTEADISTDFIEATADHLFSIKAEICLLDHYLAEVLRVYPPIGGSGFEKYAAGACYNGGPKNVFYGLRNFGVGWLYPMRRLSEISRKEAPTSKEKKELDWLRKNQNHETFIYLNKMHAIERLRSKDIRPLSPVESYSSPEPPESAGGEPAVIDQGTSVKSDQE